MNDKNLYQRLLLIMEDMGSVEKKGHNSYSGYDYIRESDLAIAAQKLFVKHGVMVFSSVEDAKTSQVTSSSGKPSLLSSVTMKYTFVNVDKPEEQFEVCATGDGMDTGDKAIYKALTGAHKYMLIRNFNLGADDEPETKSPSIGERRSSQEMTEYADEVPPGYNSGSSTAGTLF